MNHFSVQKLLSFRVITELLLITSGVVCTFLATWLFYLKPWLHLDARFDTWLEQNRCLIEAWCNSKVLIAQPLGVAFALGAFGTFTLALWMEHAMPLRWQTAMDKHQLSFTRVAFLLLTIGALLVQVIHLFYYQTPPSGLSWLVGVGSLFALGVALDVTQPDWSKTLATLIIALSFLLILLGAAGLLLQTTPYLQTGGFLGIGLVLLGVSSRWATRRGSSFTQGDHLLMIVLALTHLGLAFPYLWSWRFAFIGDEWGFFEIAQALNHGANDLKWFELRDSNSFHTILSMQLQAWVLKLFNEDVAAWRLSAVLPGALSIPAVYVVGHRLGGRQTALFSAGVFAVSHTLLCFAMIPYNNTQALFPLTAGVALFLFAVQGKSTLRYFLVGMVLGLGFIVYGLARLAVIPVGILVLFYPWPNLRTAMRRLVEIGGGGLMVAAPILLNLTSWYSLLKATPVQSELSPAELTVSAQILRNVLSGFLAFLTNPANTHFVIGPYVDPVTAVFVLIGVSYLLVTIGRERMTTAWLIGSLLLLSAISGIQQYDRIATTRMFSTVGIFAIYAGLGSTTLLKFLLPTKRSLQYGSIGILLAAIAFLNQYHITHVTFPRSEKPNIPLIIQQFQESAAADGSGMPVFVIEQDPTNSILKLILRAYQVRQERIMLLTEDEALQMPYLCTSGQTEAMLIMPAATAKSEALRNRLATCWHGYQETPLYNQVAETTLYRFASAAAQQTLGLAPQDRVRGPGLPAHVAVRGAQALAIAPDDSIFVLSAKSPKVIHYSPQGQQIHAFSLPQNNPTALTIDKKGQIIVAGGEEKLVWYDARGNIIQQTSAVRELYHPFGLAVINQNELLVSDLERRQLVHLSAQGDLLETFTVPGITWPGTLTVTPDQQHVWIYDGEMGTVTEIAIAERTILRQISAHQTGFDEAVALALLPNQNLLQTIPRQRRLIETNPQGEIVRIWHGFDQPTALTINTATELFVLDRRLEEVYRLPALYAGAATPNIAISTTVHQQANGQATTAPDSPLSPIAPPTR